MDRPDPVAPDAAHLDPLPHDYGFIPETLAEDGDPLDAMVMLETDLPGCREPPVPSACSGCMTSTARTQPLTVRPRTPGTPGCRIWATFPARDRRDRAFFDISELEPGKDTRTVRGVCQAWAPVPGGRVAGFSTSGAGGGAGLSACRGMGPTAAASTWEFGTFMTVSPVSSRM